MLTLKLTWNQKWPKYSTNVIWSLHTKNNDKLTKIIVEYTHWINTMDTHNIETDQAYLTCVVQPFIQGYPKVAKDDKIYNHHA